MIINIERFGQDNEVDIAKVAQIFFSDKNFSVLFREYQDDSKIDPEIEITHNNVTIFSGNIHNLISKL